MKSTKRWLSILLAGILVLGTLTGCGNAQTPSEGQASSEPTETEKEPAEEEETETTTLRVAVQSFYCSSLMGLIEEEGWAQEYGLELEYSVFSSGATINEAMGEWDVAVTGGAFIYALANYDCKLIAHQIDGAGDAVFVAREGSELAEAYESGDQEKLAELVKGSTILTNIGISGHYGLMLWLENMGLSSEDVSFINQDMATIYASWTAGEGDIAVLTFPYKTMVENSVVIGDFDKAGAKMYEATVCTNEIYKNNPEAVVNFVKLIYRACDALHADPDLAYQTVSKWYADYGKEVEESDLRNELEMKPFITSKEAKEMDLTEFATSYGTYLSGQGLIEPDRVESITENCANEILNEALSDPIFD